jgi:hypothetical protein
VPADVQRLLMHAGQVRDVSRPRVGADQKRPGGLPDPFVFFGGIDRTPPPLVLSPQSSPKFDCVSWSCRSAGCPGKRVFCQSFCPGQKLTDRTPRGGRPPCKGRHGPGSAGLNGRF